MATRSSSSGSVSHVATSPAWGDGQSNGGWAKKASDTPASSSVRCWA
jgi:hypothetical protein